MMAALKVKAARAATLMCTSELIFPMEHYANRLNLWRTVTAERIIRGMHRGVVANETERGRSDHAIRR